MRHKVIIGLILSSLSSLSYAVTLPGSVDPSRAGQQLPSPLAPSLDKSAGVTDAGRPPAFTPAKGTENITFTLRKVELTGNTVFSNADLAPLYQPYLNKKISFADLQKIAHAMTLKYRHAGYVLSRVVIPAQVIDQSGVVKIRVIEGYIGMVRINDHAGATTVSHQFHVSGGQVGMVRIQGDSPINPLLAKYSAALMAEKPLKMETLERYALLANAAPGVTKIKTVVQPPHEADAPIGSTDILFVPEFSRASGFVGFDNRGTKYLGPNEFSAGGALNSILQSGDQWGIQTLASSDWKELKYANIYTRQPIEATGATFDVSASNSLTRPGYLLAPLQVSGHSQEIVTDVDVPWLRTRKQSFYTLLAFDYLNNKTDLNAFNINLYDDHIRSLRFAANYFLQDKWAGANQASAQISHGLSIFNASDQNQPNLSRVQGNPQYTKFNGSLSRLQGINEHVSFYVAGIGQYTNQPLLSAEQFAFGGSQFGQAYDPAELTGDRGLAAKAELRYNTSPGFRYLNNVQYFAFYDIGKVWNVLPMSQTGLPQQASAASTGLGFRMNFNQYVFGTAEMAQPLTRDVATNQSKATRFFFSLTFTGKTSNANDQATPVAPGYGTGAATNGPDAQVAMGE